MDPKGFDFGPFYFPLDNLFNYGKSLRVQPAGYERKLPESEESVLCYILSYTLVYHFRYVGDTSDWTDKEWMFLVKHTNGYYVYLSVSYDAHCNIFREGRIRYSKSWASMWWQVLSKEERTNIMAMPWYQSCEKTRAALIALHGCRRRRQDVRNRCPRDVWQVIVAMVWEERFNNN